MIFKRELRQVRFTSIGSQSQIQPDTLSESFIILFTRVITFIKIWITI